MAPWRAIALPPDGIPCGHGGHHPAGADRRRAGHPAPDRPVRHRAAPAVQGDRRALRGRAGVLGGGRRRRRGRVRRAARDVGGPRGGPHGSGRPPVPRPQDRAPDRRRAPVRRPRAGRGQGVLPDLRGPLLRLVRLRADRRGTGTAEGVRGAAALLRRRRRRVPRPRTGQAEHARQHPDAPARRGGRVRVAAIDCGTNSIRLLVADLPADGGPLADVTRRMEIVRLGEGVDRTGVLAPVAIERTRVALAGFAATIAGLGVSRTRMVATSASRDARNADDFHAMVRTTLGQPAEVVTGDEEARLSFTGAVRGLPPARYLAVDIGGGSTEFVVGAAGVESALSVDIGCVRLTERHLHTDPPTPAEVAAASADIEAAVDRALAAVGGASAEQLAGLAGSVTTVAPIALELPRYDPERIHHARISAVDVARVTADLLGMTRAERLAIPVMHPGRADVIGAGALILRIILDRAGAGTVIASEHDILDGIAWSLAAAV